MSEKRFNSFQGAAKGTVIISRAYGGSFIGMEWSVREIGRVLPKNRAGMAEGPSFRRLKDAKAWAEQFYCRPLKWKRDEFGSYVTSLRVTSESSPP